MEKGIDDHESTEVLPASEATSTPSAPGSPEELMGLFRSILISEIGPKNPVLCKFGQELMDSLPDWFWTAPASSSGRHHPEHELGQGGLARHSLMAYRWMEALLEANTEDLSQYHSSLVLACLFHDCCKLGRPGDAMAEHTLHEHPILAAKWILDQADAFAKANADFIDQTAEDEESFRQDVAVAISCIQTHMGKWTRSTHSETVLQPPRDPLQWLVHLADYSASRKFTRFDPEFFAKCAPSSGAI